MDGEYPVDSPESRGEKSLRITALTAIMPRVVRSLRKTFGFASDAVRAAVLRANYYAGNYERAVWLIGAGRSGTTFLSRLLNWGDQYQ
jgi:hypothetical protein